ncbi:MAG TPA: phospholipase D-like domain-containing protein [Chthonomonadaceae bacterium]|nr:phospholipase D-like domain-containing protein [Chthonomonadaceae bacterium]
MTTAPPIERVQRWYRAPRHEIKGPILDLIGRAQRTIYVEIYGYTFQEMTEALIAAKERGVQVRILFDHTQACGPAEKKQVALLAAAGIEYWVGTSPVRRQIRHSKFLIVDEEWVEVGSLNYSATAFDQCNTVLVLQDKEIAADLIRDWQEGKEWIEQNEPQYNAFHSGASLPH